ncbi:MAG: UDP-N-acetylglucosamine 2-epimerase (non-hydrolyzing) [Oscillospiraceae bacterium]|nr:UDP-N-acetylglucosamine 2-epimerase (non-hydrolyzing) [Oscillospiraceae bacterium]
MGKKVMSIFGTRPEAIKMAPLLLGMERREGLESVCCVTGQHREILDPVLRLFHIQPQFDLNVMEPGQSLSVLTSRVLAGLEPALERAKPDFILVHGDTASTLAGALAGFYHQIPVGHVEAGLRTGNRYAPFPEEVNRTLVSHIASVHFCPTAVNRGNLRREGVEQDIYVTGNTVIDAIQSIVEKDIPFTDPCLQGLDYDSRKVLLVTCHRRENYGAPMEHIFSALRALAERYPEVELVYPMHPAPAVRRPAERLLGGHPRIHLLEPLDVQEMYRLLRRCYMVLSDSGGLQEEAPSLGKPVLVLREDTERPEAVEAGTVKLAGTQGERILSLASELIESPAAYSRMARAVNPYGDGQACGRILDGVEFYLGLRDRPPGQFSPSSSL